MRTASKFGLALIAAAATVASAGVANAGSSALPNKTLTFDGGACAASFTKSASGIVNESNRQAGCSNPWASAPVYLQFRPLHSTPNPACDPAGLVASFPWANSVDTNLVAYLPIGTTFNTCVYLVNNNVASGSFDSAAPNGADISVPVANGNYSITVSGTWVNGGNGSEDAEYTSYDGAWDDVYNGYDKAPYFLGEGFGDTQVNGQFVNWGAYSSAHSYSTTAGVSGGSINLGVFDGDSTTATKQPGWYGDNVGLLSYSITYLGQ